MNAKRLPVLLLIGSLFVLPSAETLGANAPPTINGGMFQATILTGAGNFAKSGSYILTFGWTEDTYTIYGGPGLAGTRGTFTYTVTSSNSAELVLTDDILQSAFEKTITFESVTRAFYAATTASGSQTGEYSYFVPLATGSSDWKFDRYHPWVWNHQTGWQYELSVSGGEWIFNVNALSWTFRGIE